jgi:hypothetical protein
VTHLRHALIAAAPGRLRAAVAGLSERQLDIPYRPLTLPDALQAHWVLLLEWLGEGD